MSSEARFVCRESPGGRRRHRARVAWNLVTLLGMCVVLPACRPTDDVVTGPTASQGEQVPGGPLASDMAAAPAEAAPVASAADSPSTGPEAATRVDGLSAVERHPAVPLRPGVVNDITFDDLEIDLGVGTLFDRSLLTPRAAQLDGQQVRLRGFIFAGGVFQQTGIASFPFVKNTQCKFGPQGLAYCVILVDLDEGVTTDFTTYPVTVEGTLTVRPFDSDGFTWSVYHLQGQRVY